MRNKWFIRKLNSKVGESLPEVLIAVLIVAMGMLALSTMLNVSSKNVNKAQTKVQAIYQNVSDLDSGSASGNGDDSVDVLPNKTVKISYTLKSQTSTNETINATFYKGTEITSYDSTGMQQ